MIPLPAFTREDHKRLYYWAWCAFRNGIRWNITKDGDTLAKIVVALSFESASEKFENGGKDES
jgi:hypothetical protein